MASEEKVLEFAREKGWDKILKLSQTHHSLPDIESALGRKITDVEIRAMCTLGLTQILEKKGGGYALAVTELGLKLLEKPDV